MFLLVGKNVEMTFSTLVGRNSMAALLSVTTVNEKREAPCKNFK